MQADLEAGRHKTVVTRFPPEPNGYLHIGHAKSICLNFGVAQEFGGRCHLRFDDTNPTKEEQEYIDAIEADVRWLGFDWGKHLYHASDYFEQLYAWAEHLIKDGKAYIDDQSQEEMRVKRGTLDRARQEQPVPRAHVEENLDLFRRMRAGEFPNGARVLRAKIDMASGNINLRDPVLYRILHATHPRTGTEWYIYPSYDYAHGQSDAIEHITHSICTLEFEDHRPLYDWFLENLPVPSRPRQYEFARLNITYTVLSKRVLTELVRGGHVSGWDDPRMPTLAGLRRRGVPPEALRDFVKRIGVAKANSVVDAGVLDFSIREVLNKSALRRMAVLRPLKVVIENYPEGKIEELEAVNHPDDPAAGTRKIRFGREIWVERTTSWRTRPRSSTASRPARRCACATPISSPAARRSRTPRARWWSCAAPTIRPPRAATRPGRAQGAGDAALGVGGRRRPGRGAALQPAVRQARSRRRQLRGRPQPEFAGGAERCHAGAGAGGGQFAGAACSSSGRAISAAMPTASRASRCSTARSACATPGRRCRRAGRDNVAKHALDQASSGDWAC